MKLLKKNEMVLSKEPLRVKSEKTNYLKDYSLSTKPENPEVIRIYIEMARKEVGVVQRHEHLADEWTDLHKPSNKRKHVASNAQKIVPKPHKKKDVQQKEIEKEIEEVVSYTILMSYKTRS